MECRASMKLKVLIIFWISLAVHLVDSKSVKYCSKKANYDVKVQGVEISPDPVAAGQPATFSISASTGEEVAGGKVVIDVFFFGVHVHSETHDLCEETACPISSGDFVLSHTQTLPAYTPPGSYTLKMKMKGASGKLLTCISFRFSIGFGSTVSDI